MTQVIKLGGSLVSDTRLQTTLAALVGHFNKPTVLVPGGGVFAEQVRTMQAIHGFNDLAAHRMAILAMQQVAELMQSLQPNFRLISSIDDLQNVYGVVIWSPQLHELEVQEITASWDITSDSLAAWLAAQISASQLVLVKAAQVDTNLSLLQLQTQGMLDAAFIDFAKRLSCPVKVISQQQFIASLC